LNHISQAPTLSPAVRAIDPRTLTPATPIDVPAVRSGGRSGSKMVLAGVAVALVGIGVAYGLTSQNGSDAAPERAAALSEQPKAVQAAAVAVAPPTPAKVEAPAALAPVAEKTTVNVPPGTVAPGEATEITRVASVTHSAAKTGKGGHKVSAAANAAPASNPSPGAAAIAAAVAAEAPAPAPAAAPAKAEAKAAPAAPAAPEPTGLAGAIKKAVGPTEPAPAAEKAEAKAAPPRGDIPELPAQGAISGALGSPRAAARNCLAGHEAPSRATIVFASAGNVQSVTVTGPAAGTPAEACIKTAMSKTVVGAFKHATFSVSTTISPP
jgi:hypothetical protein